MINLRFILLKGILAMLFVATAISCEKDQRVETKENIALTSEVVRAKEFVEARITDGFSLKSAGGDQSSIKIRARWENAKVTSNNHFIVVEAELEAMGQFGFMSSETYQKFQESGNPMYKYSLSRMVVLENKRTGKMYSFIMSIAGDREYLEGMNFKILENGYLKKEQDFSGFVLFHELTGEFTNGWVYCDGKITNTIVEADKLGVNLNLKQATIHYYVWVETCNVYLYMTSVDGIIQKIEATEGHCTSEMISAGSYTIGSEMPTSGGSGEYGPAVIEAGEACGCTICPVCGGCMVDDALKVAQLPGDDTPPPTFFDCEVCSCPKIDISGIENNEYLKERGARDLAEIFEALLSDPMLAMGDVYAIYASIERAYLELKAAYMMAIFSPDNVAAFLGLCYLNLSSATQYKALTIFATWECRINSNTTIITDNYFFINGFKFSNQYYEYLWRSGRYAPSLIAREVLGNATKITPDEVPGFNKYIYENIKLVYNPTTKEIIHLGPL